MSPNLESSAKAGMHPPLPALVLRVGVTGHRPNKLPEADLPLLESQIAAVLEQIEAPVRAAGEKHKRSFAPGAARLRVLSPLAEGSDRLVAKAALARGYELQCPLPFHRDIYATDFSQAESRAEFSELLAKATAVFELDGRRGNRELEAAAYLACGRLLVRQCDILIAIWDGDPAEGLGGTADVVNEAMELGVPVVRIDARAPHSISFSQQDDTTKDLEQSVRVRIVPPDPGVLGQHAAEVFPTRKAAMFDCLIKLWGDGKLRWSRKIASYDAKFCMPAVERYFTSADRLAIAYAARSRSVTVWMYLLACLSVVFALLVVPLRGRVEEWQEIAFTLGELSLIALVMFDLMRAHRGCWHERWLAYRSLAEHLRVLDFLGLLGRTMPEFRAPVHAIIEDSSNRWVDWHFRSIVREAGLRSAVITPQYLVWAREKIEAAIRDQELFHRSTAKRYHRVHENLHRIGTALFFLTFLLCGYHLFHGLSKQRAAGEPAGCVSEVADWMVFGAAVLPAAGAGMAGIVAQGEFKRLAERYHGMHKGLLDVINRLPAPGPSLTRDNLGRHSEEAAKILLAEVQDWRMLFKGRAPSLPG